MGSLRIGTKLQCNGTASIAQKTRSELLLGPREWQAQYVRTLPESTPRSESTYEIPVSIA
jgi:hypothetical protein